VAGETCGRSSTTSWTRRAATFGWWGGRSRRGARRTRPNAPTRRSLRRSRPPREPVLRRPDLGAARGGYLGTSSGA
jgi:hypothetical protein